MPGYEVSRFPYLKTEKENNVKCLICLCIMITPVMTPCCKNKYCEACIKSWLNSDSYSERCPTCRRPLEDIDLVYHTETADEINKMKINCTYHCDNGEGCQEIVAVEFLDTHRKTCKFRTARVAKPTEYIERELFYYLNQYQQRLQEQQFINTFRGLLAQQTPENYRDFVRFEEDQVSTDGNIQSQDIDSIDSSFERPQQSQTLSSPFILIRNTPTYMLWFIIGLVVIVAIFCAKYKVFGKTDIMT